MSRRTSSWWKVSSRVSPVVRCHEQLAHQPNGLGDQVSIRCSPGCTSTARRCATSRRPATSTWCGSRVAGTAYSGNDFAIDDISLVQRGDIEPPCQVTHDGVWFNYTGKYTGTSAPELNDTKWHALPAQPGGQHDVDVRGYNQPYQPGALKGKGDWFVWKDYGTTCPA